jgi:hypothetical protein
MLSALTAIAVGLCWGLTNTLIRVGVVHSAEQASTSPQWLVQKVGSHWAALLRSKTFVFSQLANWTGSVALVLCLSEASLHIATPIANAVAAAATAVSSAWWMGDKYTLALLVPGILLTILGTVLISL